MLPRLYYPILVNTKIICHTELHKPGVASGVPGPLLSVLAPRGVGELFVLSATHVDRLPTHDSLVHGAGRRQHNEVGVGAGDYPALAVDPEYFSGGLRSHADGVSYGDAQQLDRVAHCPVHGKGATGEGTVGHANLSVLQPNLPAAQLVLPGRHPGGLHGVGDEGETFGPLLAVGQPERALVRVHPVGDDTDPDLVVDEQRAHGVRGPVLEVAHSIVEVGTHGEAGVYRLQRLLEGGVCVSGTRDRAAVREEPDRLLRPRKFGRQSHHAYHAGIYYPLRETQVHRAKVGRIVSSSPGWRKEGTLHVSTEDVSTWRP